MNICDNDVNLNQHNAIYVYILILIMQIVPGILPAPPPENQK